MKSGKAPGTVNVAVKAIGAAFNAARRQGIIPTNPAAALESLPADAATKAVFSPKNLTAILAVADKEKDGEWGTLVRLGYYAGARLTDLSRLTWGAINWEARTLTILPQKTKATGKAVVIPLHPDLVAHLESLGSADDNATPIMPSLAEKAQSGEHGLSKTFSRLLVKAKIVSPVAREAQGEKGRKVSALSFHSLRHSFNSALANAGVAPEIRAKFTGHASIEMNARYTHLELETLHAALAHVPTIPAAAKGSRKTTGRVS